MDFNVRNIERELEAMHGFQVDADETRAFVRYKNILRHDDIRMNLVVITGGQNGMQLPHYHKHGFDFFVVLRGQGILYTADVIDGCISDAGWQHLCLEVNDSYAVAPSQAHCLQNATPEDLVFLNVSPAEHMTTDYYVFDDIDHETFRPT
jgi:mannose-6-phosphate isomerase-like protein (cupin superfamily)